MNADPCSMRLHRFPPTVDALEARLAAVRPDHYARTRNSLDGAVTGLSPYITHGFITLPDVLRGVLGQGPLDIRHRFVMELGWREYFRSVWQREGESIFRSRHRGVLPDDRYAGELPGDVREARCGVPAIDRAVRTLYETGYLHNHARLWLASYLVHIRKVSWRAGADWLYAHLLDGDLGSNHLSWQWVAGTGSDKPYLFNADNVARHAPVEWHSAGTIIDSSYAELEALARLDDGGAPEPAPEPAPGARAGGPLERTPEPPLMGVPAAPWAERLEAPHAAPVAGREVWLVHPWSLADVPLELPRDTLRLGIVVADFHRRWPWSARRWEFVLARMNQLASLIWFGDAVAMAEALRGARAVHGTGNPHVDPMIFAEAQHRTPARLFPAVDAPCKSFSQWWNRATRTLTEAGDLLGCPS